MIYVGANDGMLHAFYAATDTTDADHGQEAWAVIPSAVLAQSLEARRQRLQAGRAPVLRRRHAGRRRRLERHGQLEDDPGRRPQRGRQGLLRARRHRPGALPTRCGSSSSTRASAPVGRAVIASRRHRRLPPRPDLRQADHHQARQRQWVVMVTSGYNNVNAPAGRRRRRLPVRARRADRADHPQDPTGVGRRHRPRAAWRRSTTSSTTPSRQHDAARLRRRPARQHLALRLPADAGALPRRCSASPRTRRQRAADHDPAGARRARRQAVRVRRHRQAPGCKRRRPAAPLQPEAIGLRHSAIRCRRGPGASPDPMRPGCGR